MANNKGTHYIYRSIEDKLTLLRLWFDLDLNGREWERQTGISKRLIRHWTGQYLDDVPGLKEAMQEKGLKIPAQKKPSTKRIIKRKVTLTPLGAIKDVIPEISDTIGSESDLPVKFVQNDTDYNIIRCEMLVRIRELIRRTNNIKMLAESLKIITEVEKHTKGKGKDSPEGEVPANNIFNVIMANIEKSKQDGTQSD